MEKKTFFIGLFLCLLATISFAQMGMELPEGEEITYEGLSCGYTIRNEQEKEIGKENFARFEVTVYITNRSGCPKILFLSPNLRNPFNMSNPATLAVFDCTNANGKRLTSKRVEVQMQRFMVPQQITEKNAEGKDVTRTIQIHAGYILRNGETVSNNAIFIVPLGERPKVQCSTLNFMDF